LVLNFFSKCGIALILFSLILASFCMMGCLTRTDERSLASSSVLEHQVANSSLQMDYDVELSDDLFRVRGSLLYPMNSSLDYLLLNATLRQGGLPSLSTKYLLMDVEPNRDYSFEICKSVKLAAGEYDCTLQAEGPHGVLAEEERRVSLVPSRTKQAVDLDDSWNDLGEAIFWQKVEEEENERKRDERDELERKAQDRSPQSPEASNDSSLVRASTGLQEEDLQFVGSVTSKKYHRPDCRYAQKIKPENLIRFESVEDAKAQGYLPCKVCSP